MAMTEEGDQLKVINVWASPFGMRVLIALQEKGVQYEYQEEVFPKKTQLLLQMNPVYKMVPVLIHNGNPICESQIIVEYIDETWPHNPLLPSHPYARAQARFWGDFVDKKFYDSGFRILRTKGEAQEKANRDMLDSLELLEGALRDMSGGEGPYFGGREFGFVDIVFIPFMSWVDAYQSIGNFNIPWDTQLPLLKGWMEKCMEREIVKKLLPAPERICEYAALIRRICGPDGTHRLV